MASSVHPSSSFTTRELCLAAVMAAVVFLATFVPRIPIPLGYAHLGDAAIFLMVLFCGRRETLIAACFGSALSDLIGALDLADAHHQVFHGGHCLARHPTRQDKGLARSPRRRLPARLGLDGCCLHALRSTALRQPRSRPRLSTGPHRRRRAEQRDRDRRSGHPAEDTARTALTALQLQ